MQEFELNDIIYNIKLQVVGLYKTVDDGVIDVYSEDIYFTNHELTPHNGKYTIVKWTIENTILATSEHQEALDRFNKDNNTNWTLKCNKKCVCNINDLVLQGCHCGGQ